MSKTTATNRGRGQADPMLDKRNHYVNRIAEVQKILAQNFKYDYEMDKLDELLWRLRSKVHYAYVDRKLK